MRTRVIKLIPFLLVFSLGSCLGSATTTPEVDIVKITNTKTVKEPAPPPEEIEVVPESCLDALKYASRITVASNNMYSRGRTQLDIISQARIAIASNGDLGAVEEKQRNLSSILVGDLSDIAEAQYSLDVALEQCKKEQP